MTPIHPIFIVGSPRSGTTLMRFILSSHPDIFIPDETGFIPFLLPEVMVDLPLKGEDVHQVLKRMSELHFQWRNIVPDEIAFYNSLPQPPTLADVLDALYRQQTAAVLKDGRKITRWGDKTPLYVRHIPLLLRMFPQAQFIHMIRDGRDATVSAQKKWGLATYWYQDNYYLLKNWAANVRAGLETGQKLAPTQYLEVRYEDLVQQPEATVRGVCAFLGETFYPEMLNQGELARKVGPGPDGHTEVMRPITTASVARWRKQMTPFDQKLAQHIAGDLLGQLGYETPPQEPLTSGENLRLGLLGIKYFFSESLRTLLYKTGILTLNRTMRKEGAIDD